MPHNSHTVARLYFFGCCAKNVNGKTQSQILVDVNMPDTDILSSHKLCDLVDKILPSAFGTMIKTNKKTKIKVIKKIKKKEKKSSLTGIGKKKHELNVYWRLSPVLRTTVHCMWSRYVPV